MSTKDVFLNCSKDDFIPQLPCNAKLITAEEWKENRRRWEIYSDWGPQQDDIDKIEAKGQRMYVIFEEEKVIACAGLLPYSDKEDKIDSVWVCKERRGEGLGRRIIAFVTQEILEEGKTALYSASEDNISSIRAAKAVGFKRISK